MAPASGLPPLLAWWERHVPLSIQYVAVIIVAMMAYTLISIMMIPSGARTAISQQEIELMSQFLLKQVQLHITKGSCAMDRRR